MKADALLMNAAGAAVLIVGASEPGTATRWLLGSAGESTARHSGRPIVVMRGHPRGSVRLIVVGTDGSSAAAAALDWAADEADHHGAAVVVLHAWDGRGGIGRSMRERDLARAQAQCVVDLGVRQVQERTGCDVRGRLVDGDAAAALIAASADADRVAVGSRGPSGYKTMLFGSVALSLAEAADCPVAVFHPKLRR